ncbi:MAG: sn-glycerol-3-phosphate ABC transporter ATP-binding protein UgpC [Oscillibacter sp.]|nr:sn-glycerol-3-phosphate ABC transporter ATP-binding protein UgpC [Oscillibacter sp.]
MSEISLKHIGKRYPNGVKAVNNVSVDIADGEFVVLLGPSGCGKSTILMMLSGLEEISEGDLLIDGVRVNEMTPKERDIGLVFQSYALLPNMNVYDNIGFGLTIRKTPKREKDEKIRETARMLGLEDLLDRKPKQLSGGQKQRVAIGRCIVREPKVCLFDEPLSNLDAKLRVQMRKELIRLHKRLNATIVYVTHDQVEAMTMATKIVLLKEGEVQQIGTPEEVFQRPANLYAAEFIGSPKINIFPAVFQDSAGGGVLTLEDGAALPVPPVQAERLRQGGWSHQPLLLGIRPDRISPNKGPAGAAAIHGEIKLVEMMGTEKYIYFQYGSQTVTAKTTEEGYNFDSHTSFLINPAGLVLFSPETGQRIDV